MLDRISSSFVVTMLSSSVSNAAFAQDTPAGVDALTVTMCGTSGPLAIADRAKPCVAITAGRSLYFVDMGPEAPENISAWRMPVAGTRALFLTHFHSDHIGGIGEFNMQSWVAGREEPLALVGPEGVGKIVEGFNLAYELDHSYRKAHHENETYKYPLEAGMLKAMSVTIPPEKGAAVAFQEGDLTVTAIAVDHHPVSPAFGYRFDYRGRSVVISGDTSYSSGLVSAAKGADVVIHEAQSNEMMLQLSAFLRAAGNERAASTLADTVTYHTTPEDAVRVAKDADARMIVITHNTLAGVPFYSDEAFVGGIELTDGLQMLLARDGHRLTLPVDSEAINITGP